MVKFVPLCIAVHSGTFRTYAYLRASTKEQDAGRAKDALLLFANEHDLSISAFFEENESGATLQRPELFRLLEIAQKGDVELQLKIEGVLSDKKSYDYIQHILGCSRTTISKVSKKLKHEEPKT
jgi:DNA invertase Pin-like site-specific DNA recombinase